MTITSLVVGLLVAAIFFVVATALITFAHSVLIFGIIAVLIFLAIALGKIPLHL